MSDRRSDDAAAKRSMPSAANAYLPRVFDRTLDPHLANELALLQHLLAALSRIPGRPSPEELDALLAGPPESPGLL
jgi:hypothetical protein